MFVALWIGFIIFWLRRRRQSAVFAEQNEMQTAELPSTRYELGSDARTHELDAKRRHEMEARHGNSELTSWMRDEDYRFRGHT